MAATGPAAETAAATAAATARGASCCCSDGCRAAPASAGAAGASAGARGRAKAPAAKAAKAGAAVPAARARGPQREQADRSSRAVAHAGGLALEDAGLEAGRQADAQGRQGEFEVVDRISQVQEHGVRVPGVEGPRVGRDERDAGGEGAGALGLAPAGLATRQLLEQQSKRKRLEPELVAVGLFIWLALWRVGMVARIS